MADLTDPAVRRSQPSSGSATAAMQPRRLAAGGLIDRALPLSFTFDGRRIDRLCRRHARLGAARQRRAARRPLLQVSPPARHPHGRPRGAERAGRAAHAAPAASPTPRRPRSSSTTASRPRARTAGRRSLRPAGGELAALARSSSPASTTRPSCGRRHSGRRSTSRSSAAPPASAAPAACPTPTTTRRPARICDVLVVGAGPAGLAAALAAGRAGARVILCDDGLRPRRTASCRTSCEIDGRPAADWASSAADELRLAAQCPPDGPHHGVRRL